MKRLVLKRKRGEATIIETPAGPVRVIPCGNNKLVFEAPSEVRIHREELTNRKDKAA